MAISLHPGCHLSHNSSIQNVLGERFESAVAADDNNNNNNDSDVAMDVSTSTSLDDKNFEKNRDSATLDSGQRGGSGTTSSKTEAAGKIFDSGQKSDEMTAAALGSGKDETMSQKNSDDFKKDRFPEARNLSFEEAMTSQECGRKKVDGESLPHVSARGEILTSIDEIDQPGEYSAFQRPNTLPSAPAFTTGSSFASGDGFESSPFDSRRGSNDEKDSGFNDESDAWSPDWSFQSQSHFPESGFPSQHNPEMTESVRKFSSENVPSRWRRGSTSQHPPGYVPSSSRSSVARDVGSMATTGSSSEGVLRSKSVQMFSRDLSPKQDHTSARKLSFSPSPKSPTEPPERGSFAANISSTSSHHPDAAQSRFASTSTPSFASSTSSLMSTLEREKNAFSATLSDAQRKPPGAKDYSFGAGTSPRTSSFQSSSYSNVSTLSSKDEKAESSRSIYSPPPAREMRASSVLNVPYPPPPSMPPPPLPGFKLSGKYRSTENVESSNSSKVPTAAMLRPTERFVRSPPPRPETEFKLGYATLRTSSTSSQLNNGGSNGADKIPARFRKARDHAAAASNPDISQKPPEFPTGKAFTIHEQVRLAKIEHQRCCDEAKNFDPKKKLFLAARSKSVSSLANAGLRSTTPGPGSGLPPQNPDSSARRSAARIAMR